MTTPANQPGTPTPAKAGVPKPDAPRAGNGQPQPSVTRQPAEKKKRKQKRPAPTALSQSKPKSRALLGRDRPMAWLVLILLLATGAIPIYTYLGADRVLNDTQSRARALAEQTWHHRHMMYRGEVTLESMVPISQGQPQLDQPPGAAWLYQFALASLDPMTATSEDITYQLRLLSAAFGLLTIAAVFWAGFSVGGLTTASLSSLTLLACPVLVYYSRQGTNDMPLLGLQTLGVAAALWALRPLRPSPSLPRQAIGWAVSGGALGAVVLTGGLPAVPAVFLPILVVTVMCPNRISHLLGLLAAVFIAGLMVMPWAMYVHNQDTRIWELWVSGLWPQSLQSFTTFGNAVYNRGLWAMVLVLPWTFWLLGSIAQPFSASSSGVRRRVFIGWAWLLCVTMLAATGPGDGGPAGMVVILPAACVLIGQCLRLYSDRSAEGRHARIWRHVRWAHLLFCIAVSIALPAGMFFQDAMIERGILPKPIVAEMPWFFWVGLGVSLVLITLLSTRYAWRHYPGRAVVCWSVWSVVLMSVMLIPLTRGPLMNPAAPPLDQEPSGQAPTIPDGL